MVTLLQANLLDAAMQQIKRTQLNVNRTMELLARVRATVEGYVQTKAEIDKRMGDVELTVAKSQESMEKMNNDMATQQVCWYVS